MTQSPDDIRKAVFHALHLIAPEADLEALNPEAPLQEEIELDSMDFLRLMQQINKDLNVDVPEADYLKFSTLKSSLEYLQEKINAK